MIPSFSGAHNNAKYFIRVLVSHVACLQYTKEEQIPLFCFIYRSYHKPKAIGRRYTSQQHPSTLFHGIVVSTIANRHHVLEYGQFQARTTTRQCQPPPQAGVNVFVVCFVDE